MLTITYENYIRDLYFPQGKNYNEIRLQAGILVGVRREIIVRLEAGKYNPSLRLALGGKSAA